MLEGVFELWHSIPWIIRWPINFWVSIIFMRGILGNDITSWLKEKGLVKEGKHSYTWKVLDFVYNAIMGLRAKLRAFILSTERKETFWRHQTERHAQSQTVCTEGNCRLLT